MLAKNLRSLDQRHVRRHGAVGPDLHRQFVVVRLLTDTGLLDLVTDTGHGAENGVNGNDADFLHVRAVLAGRHVAATVLDNHLEFEGNIIGERGQNKVLTDHLNRLVRLHIGTGDGALRALLHPNHAGRVAVVLDDQALHRQHDVGDVFENALDGAELMEGAANLDLRYGAPFEARKEHAPEAVAHRRAEATLERLGNELAVRSRERLGIRRDRAGKFESTPTDVHAILLACI